MASQRYNIDTKGTEIAQEFKAQISGKVVLITGVSPNSLGSFFLETISGLGKDAPKLIILSGRNSSKVEETMAKLHSINSAIETRALIMDLQDFASVRQAAAEVNAYPEAIDVLINNAGIMAPPYAKTKDGFESTFQSNHLSHFLFTNLIMDRLLQAPEPRVVVVSSDGYRLGQVRYNDYNFHDGETYSPWTSYGQSKSANHLFARELAKRVGPKGLTSVAIHPGVIFSNLGAHLNEELLGSLQAIDRQIGAPQGWSGFEVIDYDQGVATHVFASFSPEVKGFSGGYLEKLYQIPFPDEAIYPWAIGELEQRKCWELSEKLVGEKFTY